MRDLAGAQNQYAVHRSPLEKGAFLPRSARIGASCACGAAEGTPRRPDADGKRARINNMRSPETTSWHSASWQTRPARNSRSMPIRRARADRAHISRLRRCRSWEIDALRAAPGRRPARRRLSAAGGDCAECLPIVNRHHRQKLKILLQMKSLLLHGP